MAKENIYMTPKEIFCGWKFRSRVRSLRGPNFKYENTDLRYQTEKRVERSSERNPRASQSRCYAKVYHLRSLFICYILIFLNVYSASCSIDCDFTGSGLDMDGKAVQPVYLSCSSGRVEWRYPRAALRILLQLPSGDKDFHGCIKAAPHIEGARLFVEGHRSLIPLYSNTDGFPPDKIRCFNSYKGRVALYLEAEPSQSFRDLKAVFEYDLEPIPWGQAYDLMQECRPCEPEELVRLYCSADFAARGFIVSTEDDKRLQWTRVSLAATRVFQQTHPIFFKENNNSKQRIINHNNVKYNNGNIEYNKNEDSNNHYNEYASNNNIDSNRFIKYNNGNETDHGYKNGNIGYNKVNYQESIRPVHFMNSNYLYNQDLSENSGPLPLSSDRFLGNIFMPLRCGARAGEGEFIVMGTLRFGQPVLKCAPRLEEWNKVVLESREHAQCVLDM